MRAVHGSSHCGLLKAKTKRRNYAHIEGTERLVTEIEMLKFVSCLVMRERKREEKLAS
jgi:hypothetical protein